MPYSNPERQREAMRECQRRRRAAMSVEERRQEWRDQQRRHRSQQPKVLHPRTATSVDLRTCASLEQADLRAGRAYVGAYGLEHEVGLVDETTAPDAA